MNKKIEQRTVELRVSDNKRGEFEGYIATWGTVDSYDSMFQRGAFKKTINERGGKIKVLYNHEELIGSSSEIREDDKGCFVRGAINLKTQRGKEVHELIKGGDLTGLSFGFVTIKDAIVDGVRNIREVKIYEYGPVVFPANESAEITEVRSEKIVAICEGRATDFNETVSNQELYERGYKLLNALYTTIDDVWWDRIDNNLSNDESISLFDSAISDFHSNYLEWIREYLNKNETRSYPFANNLSKEFLKYRGDKTAEQIAADTEFTTKEINELSRGNLINTRNKLKSLPSEIQKAHNEKRNAKVETLCIELRESLSDSEKKRITALIGPVNEKRQTDKNQLDFSSLISAVSTFNIDWGKKNA